MRSLRQRRAAPARGLGSPGIVDRDIRRIAESAEIGVNASLIEDIERIAAEYRLEKDKQRLESSEASGIRENLLAAVTALEHALEHLNALGVRGQSLLTGAYRVRLRTDGVSPRRRARWTFETLKDDSQALHRLLSMIRDVSANL